VALAAARGFSLPKQPMESLMRHKAGPHGPALWRSIDYADEWESTVKILFVGDVVGRPGRRAVKDLLSWLREQHNADFVIVNGENAAAGYGITAKTAKEIRSAGADCITTGNHVWAQKEAYELLESDHRILRPANYPPGVPGVGVNVFQARNGQKVGVINLLGRVFMDAVDCPFRAASELVEQIHLECDAIIVDFHAEATSEKAAMGFHLDGQVTAVIGTHTHVQTADEAILPQGTAFISDCGMTGPTNTCIGVKPDIILQRFTCGLPVRFDVPKGGQAALSGVVVETRPESILSQSIQRVRILTNGAEKV